MLEDIYLEKFRTVKTGLDTVCWDNGVDFAPEYLMSNADKIY